MNAFNQPERTRDLGVLLIDPDPRFCKNVEAYFSVNGLVVHAMNRPDLIGALDLGRFSHAIICAKALGDGGPVALSQICNSVDCTVLLDKIDGQERINALQAGARHLIAKPVEPHELAILVSRASPQRSELPAASQPIWTLERTARSVVLPDGKREPLSMSEFYVLEAMMKSAPEPVLKSDLYLQMNPVAQPCPDRAQRSLEVMFSRLRSRLSTAAFALPIKAERNRGYVFLGKTRITY